jgi:glutathione synthase/RimK-type ligase-like ATP-grasp enzyme
MSMYLYSHNPQSEGAKALSAYMKIPRIKHEGSSFKGSPRKVVINWGSSRLPDQVTRCRIINAPAALANATNKLKFFQTVSQFSAPPRTPVFTTDPVAAQRYIGLGHTVVARTLLESHSGKGIVMLERGVDFVQAPLYTLFVNGKEEYRVHICRGQIIDVQRKARRVDNDEDVDHRVRSWDNGYVYVRQNVVPPEDVLVQALKAYSALGLDFGAFDVRYKTKDRQAYVLECNTAPGLEGTTVENYAKALQEYAS